MSNEELIEKQEELIKAIEDLIIKRENQKIKSI